MNEHLAIKKQSNHNGTISSYHGEQSLVHDTNIVLSSYNVIGNYFDGNPNVYLNSLPKKAEYGYVNIRNMATGTLFDGASSNTDVNRPLLAIAVYGENHGYWTVDEAALMYGPNDIGSRSTAFKRDTTYEDTFLTEYKTSIYESFDYNALISIPLKDNEAIDDENSPLNNYYKKCDEVIKDKDIDHVHNWDEGSIIRQVTDEAPGIIKYTCLDKYCASIYTNVFTNDRIAELTFDLDGGSLPGFGNELSREFNVGSEILLPNAPEKQGYTFQYWTDSTHPADSSYIVTENTTLKAIWDPSKEYKVDDKTDKAWYKESRITPYIRIGRVEDSYATLEHFKEVHLDYKLVDRSNYEVSSGSVILEFNINYLRSLPAGNHLLEVLFDDGKVQLPLTIKERRNEYRLPITGLE